MAKRNGRSTDGDRSISGDGESVAVGRANVVVALHEKATGHCFTGEPWEQHADLRQRLRLGRRTDGWLTAGFIDRETGEFLDRSAAARRFPAEAGRTRGLGTADSSDFECIRSAKLERLAASSQRAGSEDDEFG
jgi:hypothetical protein